MAPERHPRLKLRLAPRHGDHVFLLHPVTTPRYGYRQNVQLSQERFVVSHGNNSEHIDDAIATRESNSDGKVNSLQGKYIRSIS
jgi:hypothetical protein